MADDKDWLRQHAGLTDSELLAIGYKAQAEGKTPEQYYNDIRTGIEKDPLYKGAVKAHLDSPEAVKSSLLKDERLADLKTFDNLSIEDQNKKLKDLQDKATSAQQNKDGTVPPGASPSSGTAQPNNPNSGTRPTINAFAGGATVPKNAGPDTIAALNSVASKYGIKPESISMMINLESGWSTSAPTGSYYGLTQMGATTFKEAGGKLGGLTWEEYKKATPAQQISAYGDWLGHYKFSEQLQRNGIDLSKYSAAQQAAYLQGMQFAPNAQEWKKQFAKGNFDFRTTNTSQASALGSTSIADMTRYYDKIASKNPALYEKKEGVETATPTNDGTQPQQTDSTQKPNADATKLKSIGDLAKDFTRKANITAPSGSYEEFQQFKDQFTTWAKDKGLKEEEINSYFNSLESTAVKTKDAEKDRSQPNDGTQPGSNPGDKDGVKIGESKFKSGGVVTADTYREIQQRAQNIDRTKLQFFTTDQKLAEQLKQFQVASGNPTGVSLQPGFYQLGPLIGDKFNNKGINYSGDVIKQGNVGRLDGKIAEGVQSVDKEGQAHSGMWFHPDLSRGRQFQSSGCVVFKTQAEFNNFQTQAQMLQQQTGEPLFNVYDPRYGFAIFTKDQLKKLATNPDSAIAESRQFAEVVQATVLNKLGNEKNLTIDEKELLEGTKKFQQEQEQAIKEGRIPEDQKIKADESVLQQKDKEPETQKSDAEKMKDEAKQKVEQEKKDGTSPPTKIIEIQDANQTAIKRITGGDFNRPKDIELQPEARLKDANKIMVDKVKQEMLGLHEVKDRDKIMEYMKSGGVNMDPSTTAWCAAFVNATLQKYGYAGSGDMNAGSFDQKHGFQSINKKDIQPGDVITMNGGGHVGIFTGYNDKGQAMVLGGNQGRLPEERGSNRSTLVSEIPVNLDRVGISRPTQNLFTGERVDQLPDGTTVPQTQQPGTVPPDATGGVQGQGQGAITQQSQGAPGTAPSVTPSNQQPQATLQPPSPQPPPPPSTAPGTTERGGAPSGGAITQESQKAPQTSIMGERFDQDKLKTAGRGGAVEGGAIKSTSDSVDNKITSRSESDKSPPMQQRTQQDVPQTTAGGNHPETHPPQPGSRGMGASGRCFV